MKPEQLYQHLLDTAEKLNITVMEKNLRDTGIKVRSGLCKIKEKHVFVMDKHVSTFKKCRILADCLKKMPVDDIFIPPVVREYMGQQ